VRKFCSLGTDAVVDFVFAAGAGAGGAVRAATGGEESTAAPAD
jgi:hypothetical protein